MGRIPRLLGNSSPPLGNGQPRRGGYVYTMASLRIARVAGIDIKLHSNQFELPHAGGFLKAGHLPDEERCGRQAGYGLTVKPEHEPEFGRRR